MKAWTLKKADIQKLQAFGCGVSVEFSKYLRLIKLQMQNFLKE